MPIECPLRIRNLTQDEFDQRDAITMRCSYAAQNALGRLCDERVYENNLARRVKAEGLSSVYTQIPVHVSHESFSKCYRLDLVADDALYELKTVNAFAPEHDTQALNYAMLLEINHAKLLNFRSGKVQGRLQFNALIQKRREIRFDDSGWCSFSSECDSLKARLCALLKDWGACLEAPLYQEALIHFCGGEARCLRRVPIRLDGVELGSHTIQSHAEGLCFLVTTFTSAPETQRDHLRRLLSLTDLRAMQWINLNHTIVRASTIQRI